ncbi:SCO2322 family protein [Streptomyces gobiensis]|uniref:SCO2322 family protein n=1 Tax=Streptomyces gobiensis TaxID=2875706 RepID=UPI001E283729|nr:SCO2322 family protein [Streptomyces gobiensis]UGY91140.1 hypothetical protein test1122_04975 [Streptomyces gobiensis]
MRLRSVAAAVLSAVVLALSTAHAPAPAHADSATGYRYWSFWTQDDQGGWAYATQGPATARPADGGVLGFRFAVSENSGNAAKPRGTAEFKAICAHTPAKGSQKRIALVIDPGTAADAPEGESPPKARTACAQLPENGTAAEALAATAQPLRYNSASLLCAIAGYPASGCGEQISTGDGAKDNQNSPESQDSQNSTIPLIAGIVTVALLAGGAIWQARRRRS